MQALNECIQETGVWGRHIPVLSFLFHYHGTQISIAKGDLVYIRSKVEQFVKENEQWRDDQGKLVTSEQGQILLFLVQ